MDKRFLAFIVTGLFITAGITRARAAATPDAPADLPVTHVTLYTSGVGYFERSGFVDGDASETLLFPVDQINDVLKSMLLFDSGDIQPVTFAAQDPVAKQLGGFSVDVSDNPDRATLLNRLRGASATVTTTASGPDGTITGTIVGVESNTIALANDAGTTTENTLNLLADSGLHAIKVSDVTAISLADPNLNRELREALAVVAGGRDAGKRPVTVAFHGSGHRTVMIGYLAQTPLWQTTYRLVLGDKPTLQGWALVQNTSEDDWNGVDLSLVSGRPISFVQDLYTPVYVSRPVVQPRVEGSPVPQAYNGDLKKDETEAAQEPSGGSGAGFGGFRATGVAGAVNSAEPQGINHVYSVQGDNSITLYASPSGFTNNGGDAGAAVQTAIASAGSQLGTALFSYRIKIPVSVPRGQSAMIPFVSASIQADPVSIYNNSVQADHPLSGARIKNTSGLHLMGGPITVFDDSGEANGYVGDALMDDTEPGQSRLLSYAIDLSVDAAMSNSDDETTASLIINKGALIITSRITSTTTYTFKNNANTERTVVVENPDPGSDWTLREPASATEKTASVYRFDVAVPAGDSKKFTVKFSQPSIDSIGLLSAEQPTLVEYCTNSEMSTDVKDALNEVISRRQKIADIANQITACSTTLGTFTDGQDRIRNNMKELDHASALYKRYVAELTSQENYIDNVLKQISTLTAGREAAQKDLSDYVSHLSLN